MQRYTYDICIYHLRMMKISPSNSFSKDKNLSNLKLEKFNIAELIVRQITVSSFYTFMSHFYSVMLVY